MKARTSLCILAASLAPFACAPAIAENRSSEVRVVPVTTPSQPGEDSVTHWQLHYFNVETPGRTEETSGAQVTLPDGSVHQIQWEIQRVWNWMCERFPGEPSETCADTLRVIGVPPGYLAIPDILIQNENTGAMILIVPDVLG